ncbi:30S ribosomal protein S4e [Candidatus Micrarchaeota archaeon]|nr:30S ribosomal protein S4e [Candidatus Micrarchaeota archaeon]
MAGHGRKRHLNRHNLPLATKLARKGKNQWVKKPIPGKHPQSDSISLVLLLRDRLSLAENARQAKKLLNNGEVLIDGVKTKFLGAPVGLMDVVSIPKLSLHYRVFVSKGAIALKEITAEQAGLKYCRIIGKTTKKKGKVQLNLHDARNFVIEKEEDRFKTGDTVLTSITPKQEIKGILKMEPGAKCLVFKGKHAGTVGVLEALMERAGSKATEARLKSEGESFITLKNYLIVVDDKF